MKRKGEGNYGWKREGEGLNEKEKLGSVWIELIFVEIENWNWKHCNKIIFKCINNAVKPIFNKKVAERGKMRYSNYWHLLHKILIVLTLGVKKYNHYKKKDKIMHCERVTSQVQYDLHVQIVSIKHNR